MRRLTRRPRAGYLWVGLGLLAACAGCGGETPEASAPVGEELERLRALGYVDFSSEVADRSNEGVVAPHPELASPGYRLYVSGKQCTAELIDLEGTVLRSWSHQPCRKWSNAELLPDGDLVVPGMDPLPEDGRRTFATGRYLLRLSWTGDVVWKRMMPAHHDMDLMDGGDLLVLSNQDRRVPELDDALVLDHQVTRLAADGTPRDSLSLYDVTRDNDIGFELLTVAASGSRRKMDLFHANAIEPMRRPELAERHPLYGLGNLLITLRHQNCVLVIDPEQRRLVWSWGQGELLGPHDAQVLPDGHLLIFDNGMTREWSRVIELDPVSETIVWEYRGEGEDAFYTSGRGSSQRLANGNTLLANSNSGEAREVTPEGEVVWRFWNPRYNEEGQRAVIIRIKSYDASFIEPLLERAGS